MSTFRTEFSTRLQNNTIPLSSKILTLGSCFADGIGKKFSDNKFQTLANPFGTTYNPISIHKLVNLALSNQMPSEESYLLNSEVHSHYDFHSSLSALSREELKKNIKERIGSVHTFLTDCDFLFLTYGTSLVYQLENGETVSNCHKQPSSLFRKTLLNQQTIVDSFKMMYESIKKVNPKIRIILTLSPVRHIKDTLELNSVSKSVLRIVCHQLSSHYDDVDYFPAYEIMMDDLRDYRFYSSDMIHPSADAEDYIWNKFSETYFTKETQEVLKTWNEVKRSMNHKPFHAESASHQKFLKDTKAKLESLRLKLDVSEELKKYN